MDKSGGSVLWVDHETCKMNCSQTASTLTLPRASVESQSPLPDALARAFVVLPRGTMAVSNPGNFVLMLSAGWLHRALRRSHL